MNEFTELSKEQVFELARLVAQGVAELDVPAVKPPSVEKYRFEPIDIKGEIVRLSVDVDFGDFRLELLATAREIEAFSIDQIALRMVNRIREVTGTRKSRGAHIARARSILERALERQGAGVELVEFGPEGEFIDSSVRGYQFRLFATLRVLDHELSSTLENARAWNGREFAKIAGYDAAKQRRRRKLLARLEGHGACVEIESLAERAITAAGRTVGEVATELLSSGPVKLSDARPNGSGIVCIRDGCIVLRLDLPGVGNLFSSILTVDSDLPETIVSALPGKLVENLFDHPLLRGSIRIRRVDAKMPGQLLVFLKLDRRMVTIGEINGQALAA